MVRRDPGRPPDGGSALPLMRGPIAQGGSGRRPMLHGRLDPLSRSVGRRWGHRGSRVFYRPYARRSSAARRHSTCGSILRQPVRRSLEEPGSSLPCLPDPGINQSLREGPSVVETDLTETIPQLVRQAKWCFRLRANGRPRDRTPDIHGVPSSALFRPLTIPNCGDIHGFAHGSSSKCIAGRSPPRNPPFAGNRAHRLTLRSADPKRGNRRMVELSMGLAPA